MLKGEGDWREGGREFAGDLDGFGGAAGEFENELGGAFGGDEGHGGVGLALEAVGGVGAEDEATGGAADFGGCEPGRFEDEIGGGVGDAGVESAHDAGEGEGGTGFVGDETVFGEKGVVVFVEGLEGLAVVGIADDEVAGDFGGVEGVEGLAEVVEEVVGDVDDVVDGVEADGFELGFEPSGRFGDLDAGYFTGGVVGAGGAIQCGGRLLIID